MHPITQILTGRDREDELDALLASGKRSAAELVSKVTPIQHGSDPAHFIQNEKAVHRIMCYRSASGDTPGEIAAATGYSVAQVRDVLKQPRSKQLIAEIMQEEFGDDVRALLQGGAVDAVLEIRRISVEGATDTVKLNAAKDILDRTMGKPTQTIRDDRPGVKKNLTPEEEAAAIEAELEKFNEDE